jgi:hypothetical protein
MVNFNNFFLMVAKQTTETVKLQGMQTVHSHGVAQQLKAYPVLGIPQE